MTASAPKVLLVGVGNSGTTMLGNLIHELLAAQGFPRYHYEPLYWSGLEGERNITLNPSAIEEHRHFPLLPDKAVTAWPWLDAFIEQLSGLAKFIRLGSRIRLALRHPVKVVWITRELYSYLGSMQKNFPRCLPDAGWHHRPGRYDDFERLQLLYPGVDLRPEDEYRVEVEAAWWHLHNSQMLRCLETGRIVHVRYEDFCENPGLHLERIAAFIDAPFRELRAVSDIHPVQERPVALLPRNIWIIEAIAGSLNRTLYPHRHLDNTGHEHAAC